MTTDFQGMRVYGAKDDKQTLETVELLFRNGVPHHWMNIAKKKTPRDSGKSLVVNPAIPSSSGARSCSSRLPGCRNWREHIGLRHRLPEKTLMSLFSGQGRRDWARPSVRPRRPLNPGARRNRAADRPAPARRSKTMRVSPTV